MENPHIPTDAHTLDLDIQAQLTDLLYRSAGTGQGVNVVIATLVAFLGYVSLPGSVILGWWVAMLLLSLARYILIRRYIAVGPGVTAAPRWQKHFLVGTVLTALLWMVAAVLILPGNTDTYRLLTALALAGMVAGAIPYLSPVRLAFILYASPILGGVAVLVFVTARAATDWVFGLMALVFLAGAVRGAHYQHERLARALRLEMEKRLLVENLERTRDAAEAANQAKSRFLATMSHEIRTPLNGILGMAQLLMIPDINDVQRRDYARTILDSGQTLLTLLNDILDLSKVEAGRMALNSVPFTPGALVNEVLALFMQPARAKELDLTGTWLGPSDSSYAADVTRLRQMLANLAGNAIKFTKRGFVRIEAREVERLGDHATLEFAIIDSGIGIPADKLAQLFNPFTQVDDSNTRAYGGSGLGLSIVRSLARLMEGDAGCSSVPGEGSRFWCRVRVVLLSADSVATPPAVPEVTDAGRGVAGRVLVVEDNAVNRLVIESMLGRFGVRFTSVMDGQQAVDAATGSVRPDLVLMDVQMPVLDGRAATVRIREWEAQTGATHLPIVAITAGAFEDDRQQCMAVGMDGFLTKPIKFEELKPVLERWLSAA